MNIKKLRKERNLTQTSVAKELKCSINSVRKWEIGVTTPNDDNKKALEAFFGIEWDDSWQDKD